MNPPVLHGDGQDGFGALGLLVVGVVVAAGGLVAANHFEGLAAMAGGQITQWVLQGAYWVLEMIGVQVAEGTTQGLDWRAVMEGPAVPLYVLGGLVAVAMLVFEVVGGMLQGNLPRLVQAVFRAIWVGILATGGAMLLFTIAEALSAVGETALNHAGATVDAPLARLQDAMLAATDADELQIELFVAFILGLVIVVSGITIYVMLAMRPLLLALLVVWLPTMEAVSVWQPMRRARLRSWSWGIAILLADTIIMSTFAVTTALTCSGDVPADVQGPPSNIAPLIDAEPDSSGGMCVGGTAADRMMMGMFGVMLAAAAPAAIARIAGTPEIHGPIQSATAGVKRGGRVAVGGGLTALNRGAGAIRGVTSRVGTRSPGGGRGPP